MSGRKNSLKPFLVITAGNMALTSVTSSPTNIQFLDNVGYEFDWTGSTPIGVITIEVSYSYAQDINGNVTNTGTWTSLGLSIAVSGNTGSAVVDLNQLSAPYVRAVYTKTSGTGTLTGYCGGKAI